MSRRTTNQSEADDRELLAQAVFEHGLTEPLTILELAKWFRIGRNKMRVVLRAMKGVERCGSLYRVPLRKMPPAYWTENLSRICTDLHNHDADA